MALTLISKSLQKLKEIFITSAANAAAVACFLILGFILDIHNSFELSPVILYVSAIFTSILLQSTNWTFLVSVASAALLVCGGAAMSDGHYTDQLIWQRAILLLELIFIAGIALLFIRRESDSQNARRYAEDVLNSAADALITLDSQGRIYTFNAAAERLFGYSKQEILELGLLVLRVRGIDGDENPNLQNLLLGKRMMNQGKERTARARTKDGYVIPVSITVSETKTNGVVYYTSVVRDITEHQEIQEELITAKEKAEAANLAKSQFVANMSHELRTPLNAIMGYSEMIYEEALARSLDDLVPDIRRINSAGRQLLSLINDILDLSKIESGKMEVEADYVAVRDIFTAVEDTLRSSIEKNGNRFSINFESDLPKPHTDPVRLKQILTNLVSNAAKFTYQGDITLTARTDTANGEPVIAFEVLDSGIGMNQSELDRVFEGFVQADSSTSREYGGTGLGLTISKMLSETLGADLSITSKPGVGTTCTLLLPIAPRARKIIEFHPNPTGPQPLILVIDDDLDTLDLMRRQLETSDQRYRIATVSDGARGIEMARELKPDVILLDVLMPHMDGWSVISVLKEDPELEQIPVIICSILENHRLGFAMGATAYLCKPINRDSLIECISEIPTASKTPCAMIVDDDASMREFLTRSLNSIDWQTSEATNGQRAIELLEQQIPDVILLDLVMPEMDGFEFVLALQKHPEYQKIPVIVVTGKDLSSTERYKLGNHVKEIITKGEQQSEDLVDQIHAVLSKTTVRKV